MKPADLACICLMLASRVSLAENTLAVTPQTETASSSRVATQFGRLPLAFEPNRGQTDGSIEFVSHGLGRNLYFTARNVVIASGANRSLSLSFPASTGARRIEALDQLPGKVNYLKGNDPLRWITQVPTFATVKYADVYPGIDVRFHGTGGELEYDFEVAPGADPRPIRIKFDPHARVHLEPGGDIVIDQNGVEMRQHPPKAFQNVNGTQKEIASHAVLAGNNQVSFQFGRYDHQRVLVIDPALDYAGHIGGSGAAAYAIAVDASGNVYLAGQAESGFPATAGAFQTTFGDAGCTAHILSCGDAFVMKIDSTGTSVVYATFLGGASGDIANGIAIDTSGDAYVIGATASTNFPTTSSAFQKTYAGATTSGFVTVLNPAGSALNYSTYLAGSGGTYGDSANAVAVDLSGVAYLTGSAGAPDFPTTPGAFQTTFSTGFTQAFISKIDPSQSGVSSLIYSTFIGGDDRAERGAGKGMAVDSLGNTFVTGSTESSLLATPGALKTKNLSGHSTGYVVKLNATGSALAFGTYLGGTNTNAGSGICLLDQGNSIAVDPAGNSFVTGTASTPDFPTTVGAFQTVLKGGVNAFVTKLNPSGSALVYSTLLGGVSPGACTGVGNPSDAGKGIAIDSAENVYVAGDAESADFPVTAITLEPICNTFINLPFDNGCGSFIAVLDPTLSSLMFSSFFGANPGFGYTGLLPQASGVGLDSSDRIYIAGSVASTLPTVNGPPTAGDAWVARIDLTGSAPAAALIPTALDFGIVAVNTTAQLPVTITNRGNAALTVTNVGISAFTQTNNCPASLGPSASCTITVAFSPTTTNGVNGLLTVTDSAFDSPHYTVLSGEGGTPDVSLSLSSLTFADQPIGTTSAPQPVKVSSTGNAPLMITSIATTGDFAQTNTCGSSVPARSSCTINVTFTPTVLGSRSGTLTITDDTGSSPQQVLLGGTGVPNLSLGLPPGGTSSATVDAGSTASYTLSIGGAGTSGTAPLACTGAPKDATCTVPASESVSATTATTFTVTVKTTARPSASLLPHSSLSWFWATALIGLVVLPCAAGRKGSALRRLGGLPILLILFITACGGSGSGGGGGGGSTGTPAGTYTLTVTATMASTTQSTMLTLIVK